MTEPGGIIQQAAHPRSMHRRILVATQTMFACADRRREPVTYDGRRDHLYPPGGRGGRGWQFTRDISSAEPGPGFYQATYRPGGRKQAIQFTAENSGHVRINGPASQLGEDPVAALEKYVERHAA